MENFTPRLSHLWKPHYSVIWNFSFNFFKTLLFFFHFHFLTNFSSVKATKSRWRSPDEISSKQFNSDFSNSTSIHPYWLGKLVCFENWFASVTTTMGKRKLKSSKSGLVQVRRVDYGVEWRSEGEKKLLPWHELFHLLTLTAFCPSSHSLDLAGKVFSLSTNKQPTLVGHHHDEDSAANSPQLSTNNN